MSQTAASASASVDVMRVFVYMPSGLKYMPLEALIDIMCRIGKSVHVLALTSTSIRSAEHLCPSVTVRVAYHGCADRRW